MHIIQLLSLQFNRSHLPRCSFVAETNPTPGQLLYEGRLQSSWTHLVTPNRNFVEVLWLSLFRSISLGKWWTSYNASPTSWKRAADRWSSRNFFPRSSLFMVGKAQKSHRGEIWTVWRMFWWGSTGQLFPSRTQNSIQISLHAISGLFQPRKGSSEARNFEVINGLQHVFEKWVERCKKCIACQGRYFEKETVTAPPQSSDPE
jgi:hypothetical protein